MKVDTSQKKLVRGYVVYSQWRAGRVSLEDAKSDDEIRVGIAYTLWHRHDEDPKIVEDELDKLSSFYMKTFKDIDCCMLGFEYRDYTH